MVLRRFPWLGLIKRELLRDLRRVRAFVCLCLAAGTCLALVAIMWPGRGVMASNAGPMSQEILRSLATALGIGATLFLPGLASLALASEREQDTYDQLRLTLISTPGVIMAKLLNVMGFYLLLFAAVMPAMATVFFLVGLDWYEVAWLLWAVFLNVLVCGVLGLASGSLFRRPLLAVLGAYAAVGVFYGVLFLAAAILIECRLLLSTNQALRLGHAYCAVTVLAGLLLAIVRLRLRRTPKPVNVTSRKPIDDLAILQARAKRFPYYILDPLRRKKAIEDHRNPLLVKELRCGFATRPTAAVRVFYVSFFVYTGIGILISWPPLWRYSDFAESARISLVFQTLLTIMAGPALMANAFAGEREAGSIDMLRMTLLRPWQYVAGKAAAGIGAVAPLLLGLTCAMAPVLLLISEPRVDIPLLLSGYATLYVCTWVSLCVGLYVSLHAKRTSASLMVSHGVMAVIIGGIPMLFAIWDSLNWGRLFGFSLDEMMYISGTLSPIVSYCLCCEDIMSGRAVGVYCWCASLLGYFCLGWILLGLSVVIFRFRHMRDR